MALGIRLKAEIKELDTGVFPLRDNPVFSFINNIIDDFISQPLMKRYLKVVEIDNTLKIKIHPAEEFAVFKYNKDLDTLEFSAKTNSAGPGYHIFLADFLEKLEKELDLVWQAEDENSNPSDKELNRHLNLDLVQREMLTWLHASANKLVQMKKIGCISVCLPVGFGLVDNCFVISPLGIWNKKWFEGLARQPLGRLREYGEQFFPWWHSEFDADFWLNWGLALSWTKLPWHYPVTEKEKELYKQVLDSFDEAENLNPNIILPDKEIAEIKDILDSEDCNRIPAVEGIGFNRKNVRKSCPMGWTIVLPGYYYRKSKTETEIIYHFLDRIVVVKSFSTTNPGEKMPFPPDKDNNIYILDKGSIQGWAKVDSISPDKSASEYNWSLHGYTEISGNICETIISFAKEEDKKWALNTWKSLFHPLYLKKLREKL